MKDGARESRRIAPRGARKDPRPGHTPLHLSIRWKVEGMRGYWYSTSEHALPQELGSKPHMIVGKVKFFWLNSGEWFVWNHPKFGPRGSGKPYENWDEAGGATIRHPGNKAQAFLEPAFDRVARSGGTIRRVKASYRRHGLS